MKQKFKAEELNISSSTAERKSKIVSQKELIMRKEHKN